MVKKKIKDSSVLWLIKLIIDSTPSPGIPIGNLASQIFANLYLSGLDHYLKETIKCEHYIRYMDDLIVFGDDKDKLSEIRDVIRKYLKSLKLELHSKKSQIYLSANGVDFLGYKVYPTHRLVAKRNIIRERKQLKAYLKLIKSGSMAWSKLMCSMQSWFGYSMHADSFYARRSLLAKFNLLYEGISP
jgi:hypothetical protein